MRVLLGVWEKGTGRRPKNRAHLPAAQILRVKSARQEGANRERGGEGTRLEAVIRLKQGCVPTVPG